MGRAQRWWWAAAICAALGLGLPASSGAAFRSPVDYQLGTSASAIGYGDYNGDGVIDLVVARPSKNDVVFLAGRGDGTFAPAVSIPVGIDPVAVTSCAVVANDDWMQNGRCGLAVSDAGSHDVAVLTGNGDGTFKPPVFYPVDGAPGAIDAGTLIPGTPAIAFVEPASDRVGVLVSAGHGTFQPEASIAVGHHPVAIDADELNATRRLMVVEEGDNDVRTLLVVPSPPPPGLSLLNDAGTTPVGASPRAIAPFGDGSVAVANHDSGTVTIFGGCGPSLTLPAGPAPSALTWLSLTGPNDPTLAPHDLAVVNAGQHTLTLLTHQTGGGCLGSASNHGTYIASTLPIPVDPIALVARPFDRIGLSDLALLDPAGQVAVMLDATPTVAINPTSVDFGNVRVGQSATAKVQVINVSQIPTNLRQATVDFPQSLTGFELDADGCAWRTLGPGQSCSITIRFAPLGTGGYRNQLLLEDDAADSQYLVPINGTGVIAAAISSPHQSLTRALRSGVRAFASCSGPCRVTIQAEYQLHHRLLSLGTAHASLAHKGRAPLRIRLHPARTPLAHATSGRILLQATITARKSRPIHVHSTIKLGPGA